MINFTKPGRLHVIINRRQIYITFWRYPLQSWRARRYHYHYVFGDRHKNGDIVEPWPTVKALPTKKDARNYGKARVS
jgi:hypothetical protein